MSANFISRARLVDRVSTEAKYLYGVDAKNRTVAVPYSVTANGTDDTDALRNAIAAVVERGGGVVRLSAGTYTLTSTIEIDASNVAIIGDGADTQHDYGSNGGRAATKIIWAGGSEPIFRFTSGGGATSQRNVGCSVQNIWFSMLGVATYGLEILSQSKGYYRNLHFNEPATAGIYMGTVAALGEARDPQDNRCEQISTRAVLNASSALILDGDAGASPTANTSMNYFSQMRAQIKNGDGFVLRNCDNNFFDTTIVTRASGGTGKAIVFHGSDDSASGTARYNYFRNFTGHPGVTATGTTRYTHASHDNWIIFADVGNGTGAPTIEADATCWFSTSTNVQYTPLFKDAVFSDNYATALTEYAAMGTETVRIRNTSSNHVRFTNADSEWGLSIDGANQNLRVTAETGASGVLDLAETQVWTQEAVMSDSAATVESEATNLTTETVRVRNTSSNHFRLVDASANEWGINIEGTSGDLRLTRVAGTGLLRLPNGSSAAATPANFSAARYLAINDSSGTTYYIPLATATW